MDLKRRNILYVLKIMGSFESLRRSGAEKFKESEAVAREGVSERARNAQKKAAERQFNQKAGKIDVTAELETHGVDEASREKELESLKKKINGVSPDAFEES